MLSCVSSPATAVVLVVEMGGCFSLWRRRIFAVVDLHEGLPLSSVGVGPWLGSDNDRKQCCCRYFFY